MGGHSHTFLFQAVYGGFGFFLFYEHYDPVVVFYEILVPDYFAVEVDVGYPFVSRMSGAGQDSYTGYAYVVYVFQQVVDFVSGHLYEDAVVVSFRERKDGDGRYFNFCS